MQSLVIMDVLIRYDLSCPWVWKAPDLPGGGAIAATRYADLPLDVAAVSVPR